MSTSMQPWQPLSRNDRHVQRASLRLPAGVSEHRATVLVEEALRLMTLPGEDQGRTYYFRRVALRGLAMAAPTHEWVERAQSTMQALAVRAVHGMEARAADADAVFFNSQEETLQWLLGRLFRVFPSELSNAEWFVPLISQAGRGSDATAQVVAGIERLRSLPAGWFAASIVLLDAMERDSAALAVLESIPERVMRTWLSELGGASENGSYAPKISEGRRRTLRRALARKDKYATLYWGSRDGRAEAGASVRHSTREQLPLHLLWVATLTVIEDDPSELVRGSAIASAMAILRDLTEPTDPVLDRAVHKQAASSSPASEEPPTDVMDFEEHERLADAARAGLQHDGDQKPARDHTLDASLFTAAGGLYFLLNVLRLLGIERAIEALPAPQRKIFLPKLIWALATAAAVAADDAAMRWVVDAIGLAEPNEDWHGVIFAEGCWPRAFLAAPEIELTLQRLVRVWTVAVRHWCWLNARLPLREIVARPGRIRLTRTDLDVTFAMNTVDLRLRRVGLDLDPGWLPWFGRVVRFHYVYEAIRNGVDGGQSA